MIKFTNIEYKDNDVKLSNEEGDAMYIPNDKLLLVTDESGVVSIKTIGSRATIGILEITNDDNG